MSIGFYIALLLGILIFLFIFWYSTKSFYEKFEGTTTDTTTTTTTATDKTSPVTLLSSLDTILATLKNSTAPQNFEYVEDVNLIPNKEKLQIYLTTFSDKTNYDTQEKVYNSQTQKWNNFLIPDEAFLIVSTNTLPESIKAPTGLELRNRTLNGIRSDVLNQSDYILGSFSSSFYLKFNNIDFEEGVSTIEMLDIYVETPNYVKVYLEQIPNNTTDVNIILHVGGPDNRYDIKISKDTLKSNGNLVLMTVVYDAESKPNPKLYCYIGESAYEKIITPAPQIYLGNSRIRIGGTGRLDASLHAFMFFKSVITLDQQKSLKEYLEKQRSGINDILNRITQLTEEQINMVRSLVSDQTLSLEDLRNQLQTCKKIEEERKKEEEATPAEFKYKIGMQGTSDITAKDLESCSVLKVKERGASTKPTTTTSSTDATTTSTTTSTDTKKPFQIDIPFLNDVTAKEADLTKVLKGYFTRPETTTATTTSA